MKKHIHRHLQNTRAPAPNDGETDVFNPTRYKSLPKLQRLGVESIDYDGNGDNVINEQIDANNQQNNFEDGAWGGGDRNRALSCNDLKQEEEEEDDAYVEFIGPPNTSNSSKFIANSLKINKKNRRPT